MVSQPSIPCSVANRSTAHSRHGSSAASRTSKANNWLLSPASSLTTSATQCLRDACCFPQLSFLFMTFYFLRFRFTPGDVGKLNGICCIKLRVPASFLQVCVANRGRTPLVVISHPDFLFTLLYYLPPPYKPSRYLIHPHPIEHPPV